MRGLSCFLLVSLAACDASEDYLSPLARAGAHTYRVHCAACHHATDPSRDGVLGPAVLGSSRELLVARVRDGSYPPGYKPKRETRTMVPVPAAVEKIDALFAYLQEYRPD